MFSVIPESRLAACPGSPSAAGAGEIPAFRPATQASSRDDAGGLGDD